MVYFIPFCYICETITSCNGKEEQITGDLGLLDFGARMYDPALGRWHSIDPKAEKRYGISSYIYCSNDPINRIDPDGEDDYYTIHGDFIYRDENGTDYIFIRQYDLFACWWNASSLSDYYGVKSWYNDTRLMDMLLPTSVYSRIFTDVLRREGVDLSLIKNGMVSVKVVGIRDANYYLISSHNDPSMKINNASWVFKDNTLTATVYNSTDREFYGTVSNIVNMLVDHELTGHGINGWRDETLTHHKVYEYQMQQPSWRNATDYYKEMVLKNYDNILWREGRKKLKK